MSEEENIAKDIINKQLCISEVIDSYWSSIVKNTAIPNFIEIYKELVNKKYTENNPHCFNDADDSIYYIKSKSKKIVVYTTQNKKFLFIYFKEKFGQNFFIRQFYDDVKNIKLNFKDKKELFDYCSNLNNYSNVGSAYTERPNFQTFTKNNFKKGSNDFVGDFADPGHILSYKEYFSVKPNDYANMKVWSNHVDLKYVIGFYLKFICQELKVNYIPSNIKEF